MKKKKKEFGESLDVCFLIQDISLASPSHMWKTLLLCTFETAAILVESSKALETEFEELHVGHQTRFIGIHPLSVFPIYSMYVCMHFSNHSFTEYSLAQCKSAKLILVTIIYYILLLNIFNSCANVSNILQNIFLNKKFTYV